MDKIAASIRNRLSLRPPQEESLNILANLSNKLSLAKNSPPVLGGDTGVVNNQPVIITGDNYSNAKLFASNFHINIFNISKVNSETRGGNAPRIKRHAEFPGESYFNSNEVREKSQAALEYCKFATEYTGRHGGKPWVYVLIPHNAVQSNMGLQFLADKYKLSN